MLPSFSFPLLQRYTGMNTLDEPVSETIVRPPVFSRLELFHTSLGLTSLSFPSPPLLAASRPEVYLRKAPPGPLPTSKRFQRIRRFRAARRVGSLGSARDDSRPRDHALARRESAFRHLSRCLPLIHLEPAWIFGRPLRTRASRPSRWSSRSSRSEASL